MFTHQMFSVLKMVIIGATIVGVEDMALVFNFLSSTCQPTNEMWSLSPSDQIDVIMEQDLGKIKYQSQ